MTTFQGAPAPEVFVDAVSEAARLLAQQTEQELQRSRSWIGEPRAEVLWESLLFVLHLTDRVAFARMGAVARDGFVQGVLTIFAGRIGEEVFRDEYAKSQARWSVYGQLAPTRAASPKGTLFWEFGKSICQQFNEINPAVAMMVSMRAAGIFESLDHAFQKLR